MFPKPVAFCFTGTGSLGSPSRPLPALPGAGSCGYRFKNPSLSKTLMINQAADPSAAASSGRAGGSGREGCGGRAERSGLPRKGRVPQSEAAGWVCARCPQPGLGRSQAKAGAGAGSVQRARGSGRSRAARPHRAGDGGRGVCGLLSPDVRQRRPRPERALWGLRSRWRWAPSTTWHFSCNSAAPRGPPATRLGTTTSPAMVSSVTAPADFPIKPHPGLRRSNLSVPGLEPAVVGTGVPGRPLPGPWIRPGNLATPAEERAPRIWLSRKAHSLPPHPLFPIHTPLQPPHRHSQPRAHSESHIAFSHSTTPTLTISSTFSDPSPHP